MSVTEPLVQASLIGEGLDRGPALVFVADEHMRFAAVNALACDELGYSRDELVGMAVAEACRFPDDGELAEVTRKDGTSFRMRYRAAETTIAGMPFYISVGWAE
ncbi:MAG TPA: PAS domain-containing protein [Gaiellaceae bacterium]|jgi:PAS domain S-box-containing protein|nr:PAS domain-containing protein [Gaiellaceae bacterium]